MNHRIEESGDVEERAEDEAIEARTGDDGVNGDDAGEGEQLDDAEEDDDEGERELEEGEEYCPICERLNFPGAMDACEHYFGNCWDGEIMWSNDAFDVFSKAWSELVQMIEEEVGPVHEDPLLFCKSVALQQQLSAEFLCEDLLQSRESSALEQLVEFSQGDCVETDGMLSGSGYSLYLESTQPVDQLVARIRAVIAAVRKALQ